MAITEALVDKWIRRDEAGSRWHMVQSIFVGEALTKCGKFMAERTYEGIELEVKAPSDAGNTVMPSRMCKVCFPGTHAQA